jgi:predicted ferric reductase
MSSALRSRPVSPPAAATRTPQRAAAARTRGATVALWLAGAGLGLVVGIQLATRLPLSGPGALLMELGRWTGLLGTYAALIILLLVARVPFVERSVGLDTLMSWHRKLGPISLLLIAAHVVLITAGYAAGEANSYLAETWSLVADYPWVLPAMAGFLLMVMGGLTSWRVARRRMKYETWWVTHLYFYLAIALAYAHQVGLGQQFVTHPWARWIWIGLYLVTLGALVVFRFGAPIARSLRHDLKVHSVVRESSDTISIWISGRNLDRLAVRGGQFFGWRFLTPSDWWQSHPYSLSAGSDPRFMRITVKDLGDQSGRLASLKPGTRIIAEGPYGVFTADARSSDRVVLIAGGVGITPIRALLDDLPPTARVDLLYRAPEREALVLREELEAFAANRPGLRVRYLVGNRRDYPLHAKALIWLVPDIASADVYVCGPNALVDAVVESTHVLGMPSERVHHEAFSFHSPDTYGFGRRTKETTR